MKKPKNTTCENCSRVESLPILVFWCGDQKFTKKVEYIVRL